MKKKLFFLILFLISIFALYKLTQSFSENTSISSKSKEENIIKLVFGHHMPKNHATHKAALHFADIVSKKTDGKVKIEIYPEQELGNSFQMIELARKGDIDILITPTAKMSVLIPSMQYADLPFLFPSKDDAYALLDGKVGESLLKELDKVDMYGAAFWEGGFKNFFSTKPLETPESFNDQKIRTMKSDILIKQFEALGAKPLLIDFHSLRKALQDNVVVGFEMPLISTVGMKFHHDVSDLTLSQHGYLAHIVSFSNKSFQRLPVKIQKVLISTAKELVTWQREQSAKDEKSAFETIKKAGINIHNLSPEIKKEFKDKTAHIMKQYEDIIGANIISETQNYYYDKYPQDNIAAIGVDADLSMGAKGSGLAIKRGVELACDEINTHGGLLGKKVVVVARDHKGTSTEALENINKFIEDNKTIGVIGGKHSAIIKAYTKEIQDNQLVFFSPWAAAPSVTDNDYKENYIFRVSLNDKYSGKFLAEQALKKCSNPAVIVENSVWGKSGLKNIRSYLLSRGLQDRDGFIINRGETNFNEIFSKMHTMRNDGIIMVLNAQEAKRLVIEMGKKGFHLPIISHWGIVGDAFFDATKTYLDKIDLSFIQTFSFVNNHRKEAANLKENYLRSYARTPQESINAVTGVVQAYDSVMLLASAVENAGSFDHKKVKDALENINKVNGVIKTYKYPFDKVNHDALGTQDFFMAKYDEKGNIIPVKSTK